MQKNEIQIYSAPLPFSNKQVKATAIFGMNLQAILDFVCPDINFNLMAAIVIVDGKIIPKDNWQTTYPTANSIVNIRIIPQNGGGGGKNPLATVLSIAVLVAAPYLGAGLATTIFGAAGATGFSAFTGALLTAGVGIVGSLLINAIAPPPKPSNLGRTNDPAESPTQFIEGASNALLRFGVVPVCLGTNRMFPPLGALTYTETQDNEQFSRQLFCYGYGEKLAITDLKIGETALSDFTDVDLEHKLEGDLHEGTALYSNDVFQESFNVLLEEADGFTTRTTQADIDEFILDVTFPQGLTEYNSSGNKVARTVQLEIQYAISGASPQVWSPGAVDYVSYAGDSLSEDATSLTTNIENISGTDYFVGYRKDIAVIDNFTGVFSLIKGPEGRETSAATVEPVIPANKIRLSTIIVRTKKPVSGGSESSTIESLTDDRAGSLFGTLFENAGDFLISNTGFTVNIAAGDMRTNPLEITAAQSEALRKSVRVILPENNTYDVRIRRITADSTNDQVFDTVYLTAIKSVTYINPVNKVGVNGTAMRIKGTNQLTGAVDQFNCIVSNIIDDYDAVADTWTPKVTSNPASIYRYVLQGLPNGKRLVDTKLNLEDIAAWHVYCDERGYTYNKVIDYETNVDEILRDVCSAGAATPAIVDGKRTIVIDKAKEDIVQIFTPRNTWGYSGELIYPDLPHAFRVNFRNAAKGYQQDERIVYDDGYNSGNATIFEVLDYPNCTNSDLAFKHARRHLATARLRPEKHTFMCDVEHLVALRGDRVKLAHDVPIIGVGDGRIKTIITDNGSPELVTGFTIDDTVTIPDSSTYYVRIRLQNGEMLYKELVTTVGDTSTFTFAESFALDDSPGVMLSIGDLCYFVEAGGELDLIIQRIEPIDDNHARIIAVDYAPAIFTAETIDIPAFTSNITTPLEFIRLVAPVLLNSQSDESVMLLGSDGSYISRAVFTLQNNNEGEIETDIKVRRTGTSVFTNANVLEATEERVIITGLEDGKYYDIWVRYRRRGSTILSVPLQINNYLFVGASGTPSDITSFKIDVTGNSETAIFSWNISPDLDRSHSRMKFSPLFSGANWETAQLFQDNITDNRLVAPFQAGTYLIKDIDYLGNESENAAVIITYNPGIINNVVEVISEHENSPYFNGTKDNVELDIGPSVILTDVSLPGYYYFENSVDLGAVYTSFVSAIVVAGGASLDSGNNDIFDFADIFAIEDIFGIGTDGWAVELQFRTTQTDPNSSPVVWSDWQAFSAGYKDFWAIEFRVYMVSTDPNITPKVSQLTVSVDMPDRIEKGDDLTVDDVHGAVITYSPEFKNNPAVGITLQDGLAGDRIEYLYKLSSGFSFKVYNEDSATYVTRTYDYISVGWGRKQV